MIFTSYTYVAFLLATFIVHWSLPVRFRKGLLVVASYVFYCSWDWRFGFLLLGVSLFNWAYGRWVVARHPRPGVLPLGILINLAPLVYFKYSAFLLENVRTLLSAVHLSGHWSIAEVVLPLGVSFFTFQGIAYLVDVATGDPPFERLLDFLLYKALWPQLIAGPIIRPAEIRPQIEGTRQLSYEDVAEGCRRLIIGFAKKILVADMLAEYVDMAFLPGASPGFVDALVGTVGFGLQIYFDFSAYSDIAIGSARLFAFRFPENFAWPYLSRSPQEFWTRWHITLSLWIRDYVFTPLSFSQRHRPRLQKYALLAAMAVCGLWHGARWTFVLWGLWHGLLLVVTQTMGKRFFARSPSLGAKRWRAAMHDGVGITVTALLVFLGWILFRAQDLYQAVSMLTGLFTVRGGLRPTLVRENGVLIVFAIFVIVVLCHIARAGNPRPLPSSSRSHWRRVVSPIVYAAMIIAVIIFDKEARAFVYFQF